MFSASIKGRAINFFKTVERSLHNNALYEESHKVIKKNFHDDQKLWSNVKKQVELAENIEKSKRPPTHEEHDTIDYGPFLARNYDSKKDKNEMQSLYTIFNRIKLMTPFTPTPPKP